MAEFREDAGIYPLLIELAGCLEAELEESGLHPVSYLALMPGFEVAFDAGNDEDCGQGWVKLLNAYPAGDSFPEPDSVGTCISLLGFEVEVGIVRCLPVADDSGNPPSVEDNLLATRNQLADMAAMHRAIRCCLGTGDRNYVLGTYNPYGPLGGIVGGTWTFRIQQEF
jgi:hypothetical protein